ncbi:MAG: NAD-dependent epimerase/dehydratase family protein [Clostridia bacterium]
MNQCCIVTGGAGFIGCALSAELLRSFDRVIAFDCLHPQIHKQQKRPEELAAGVELFERDVCHAEAWDELLQSLPAVDTIVHLAAETGTAQSLTQSTRHASVNVVGTTQMLDALLRAGKLPKQILLTSSRAVYGEGAWKQTDGTLTYPGQRTAAQLEAGQWDFENATYLPANATTTLPNPSSVYGATKLCQENLLHVWGGATGVGVKVVRLQNVYGPGQSLTNPYTGIVSLFVRLAKAGESIPVYEDGEIVRDFVLIHDVRDAILQALVKDAAFGQTIDIGTGKRTTILEIAQLIAKHYHAPMPQICGKYRNGDVRCGMCDATRAQALLGFKAAYAVEQGVNILCDWIDERL